MRKNANTTSLIDDDPNYKNYQLNTTIKSIMIKEAFNMFDSDGSGEIDTSEFEKLVMSLGLELDKAKIRELYKEIDSNMSGSIDMEEFTEMMLRLQFSNNPSFVYSHLLNTFNKFDHNCDGYIDKYDLMKVGEELDSIIPTSEEMELLVSIMKWSTKTKSEYSDRISREEFINAMNNLGFIQEIIVAKKDTDTTDDKNDGMYSERDRLGDHYI